MGQREILGTSPRLSLCMIVRNEEEFLGGCLESVRGVVDEIVIVDTGSTDATRSIAASFGAVVLIREWTGDFSAARNASLERATGEWALVLDADERLSPDSALRLRGLLRDSSTGAFAVTITGTGVHSTGSVRQVNRYPRLFRRREGVRFEGVVHEQVAPSLARLGLRISPSPLIVEHLGYDRGWEVVRAKAERNALLLRHQLECSPDDAYAHFQLGNTLALLGQHDEAETALSKALEHPGLETGPRASALNLLAEIAIRKQMFSLALERTTRSLALVPGQHLGYWLRAAACLGSGDAAGAVDPLRRLLHLASGPLPATILAFDVLPERPRLLYRLGICLQETGRIVEAARMFLTLLREDPAHHAAASALAECVHGVEDSRESNRLMEEIGSLPPGDPAPLLALASREAAAGRRDSAEERLRRVKELHPVHAGPYLLGARWAVEAGELEGAERMLERAAAAGINDYALSRIGLELALQRGDMCVALRRLEQLAALVPAGRTDVRERLSSLAASLRGQTGRNGPETAERPTIPIDG